MWDPFYAERTGLPVKEQHSCVHIHRDRLSAVPHHLHLHTHRKTCQQSEISLIIFQRQNVNNYWVVHFCLFTWKEWTGSCLTWFLIGVVFADVSSEGGGFGCTARLWLATASCNAFNTFMGRKSAVSHPKQCFPPQTKLSRWKLITTQWLSMTTRNHKMWLMSW